MKKNLKINLAGYLKHSFLISILVIIIILSIFVYFLYLNVYQALAEAQEVTSLRQNVISEKIEKTKFLEIISNMKKKITPVEPISIISKTSTSTISTTLFQR